MSYLSKLYMINLLNSFFLPMCCLESW